MEKRTENILIAFLIIIIVVSGFLILLSLGFFGTLNFQAISVDEGEGSGNVALDIQPPETSLESDTSNSSEINNRNLE
ncbi:MAG: hypothetical protein ACOCUU_01070 [Nanoarchaeota archaeon]